MVTARTVLVTGGSGGIGGAIAQALAASGCAVTNLGRHPAPSGDVANPSGLSWIPADLVNLDTTLNALENWLHQAGRTPDVLIHCAVDYGLYQVPLVDTSVDVWDRVFAVNVRALFAITRLVLPVMLKQPKGLVLGITSDAIFGRAANRIPYAASKMAAHSVFTGLAAELASTSVAVAQLLPRNVVDTPGIRRRRPPDFDFSAYNSAESVARAVQGIVESDSDHLNGKCIMVEPSGLWRVQGDLARIDEIGREGC
jgi:NAD(P)-dependent dehydrogenase (short-subunit alcohol dehydrogenase family)